MRIVIQTIIGKGFSVILDLEPGFRGGMLEDDKVLDNLGLLPPTPQRSAERWQRYAGCTVFL
jgi:hypothetical protein